MNLIQHFVNGKIIPGKSDRRGKVFNPAIGEQESEVILGLKSDLEFLGKFICTISKLFLEVENIVHHLLMLIYVHRELSIFFQTFL